jgi:hypothetical protein
MTAVGRRPRRRKAVIGAVLLAPLALLGARRAMRAGAVRRSELEPALLTRRHSAPASVEPEATQPPQPSAADPRKRKRRAPRLVLVAVSLAAIGAFIQHAQSRVPRPTLVLERPTSVQPSPQTRPGSDEVPKSPAAVPASPARAPRRSGAGPRHQTPRQQHPKHQSHPLQSSGRRPTQPVLPTKHARERPVPRVHAVSGRALRRLRWNAVAGATYYNLVLWRDGKRVLDLWPTSPRVVVPTTLVKHGPQARLSPGRYLWFVYPGFGAKPARHYGALAESGVLVVQPKGGNEG